MMQDNYTTIKRRNNDCLVDLKDTYAGNKLYQSLQSNGYTILKNHNISIELLDEIIDSWKPFFLSKNKYTYLRTDSSDEGFIPLNYETASKELTADIKELYQTHYTGEFPSEVDTKPTKELFKQTVKLTKAICQILDDELPHEINSEMQSSLSSMVTNSNNHLIRIIHYPPVGTNAKSERAAAHTDICLFTMVFGAVFNGLEFKDHNDEWFEPEISPTEIVLFNSEMIELCTNGHLKALFHRVRTYPNSSKESRFSVPIGFHPTRSALLKQNLTASEHLKNRLNEMGYNGNLLNLKDH